MLLVVAGRTMVWWLMICTSQDLFLSEFIEMINSLKFLLLGENSDCLGSR